MEHLDERKKVIIMISIMAAMFFASVNQTIVGNALPRIISELGGMDYYSWVFTIYMLTSAVTTILVGRLSDMYGRKPFLLIGILIFTVGAFLSGMSQDIFQLITYRGIQGFGAGMIMSSSFSAVGDLFSPRERGKWNGLMASVFGLSSVFGPTMGGYIVDHFTWHWVFWVFLPLGIVAFLLIWMLFPKVQNNGEQSIDYFGALFLTGAIVPTLLAFSWAGTKYDWDSIEIVSLFSGAIVSLIIFIFIEKKAKVPIIPLYLFKNSAFTISNLVGFTIGVGMFGASMYVPFFIQGVLGFSATHSSFITMTLTLSLVAGSIISGQITSRTGKYKNLAIVGLIISTIGMLFLSHLEVTTSQYILVVYLIAVGFGLGVAMSVFTLTVQNAVNYSVLGVATGSSQLFRSLGGTVGVSIMSTVLNTNMAYRMEEFLKKASGSFQVPAQYAEQFTELKNPQILLDPKELDTIHRALPPELQEVFMTIISHLRDAMNYAISGVFWTGCIVMFLAVILTVFLKEMPLRTTIKEEPIKEKSSLS